MPSPNGPSRRTRRRDDAPAARLGHEPGRDLATRQRAVGEIVERSLAERSACRSASRTWAGSGSGQIRVTVTNSALLLDPTIRPSDLELALAQDVERRRGVEHGRPSG